MEPTAISDATTIRIVQSTRLGIAAMLAPPRCDRIIRCG